MLTNSINQQIIQSPLSATLEGSQMEEQSIPVTSGARTVSITEAKNPVASPVTPETTKLTDKARVLSEYKITKMEKFKTFMKAFASQVATFTLLGTAAGTGLGVLTYFVVPAALPLCAAIGAGVGAAIGLTTGTLSGLDYVRSMTVEEKLESLIIETEEKSHSAEKKLGKSKLTDNILSTRLNKAYGNNDTQNLENKKQLLVQVKTDIKLLQQPNNGSKDQNTKLKNLRNLEHCLHQHNKLSENIEKLSQQLRKLKADMNVLNSASTSS